MLSNVKTHEIHSNIFCTKNIIGIAFQLLRNPQSTRQLIELCHLFIFFIEYITADTSMKESSKSSIVSFCELLWALQFPRLSSANDSSKSALEKIFIRKQNCLYFFAAVLAILIAHCPCLLKSFQGSNVVLVLSNLQIHETHSNFFCTKKIFGNDFQLFRNPQSTRQLNELCHLHFLLKT